MRKQLADQTLLTANGDNPAFDYGKACGIHLGLRRAEALLLEMIDAEKNPATDDDE